MSALSFPSKAVLMKLQNYLIKKFPATFSKEMKVLSDSVFDGPKN
jgi:hypothetical protein